MSQHLETEGWRAPAEPVLSAEANLKTVTSLLALAAGVGVAIAALPVAFRLIPNDLSRIATVLDALHETVPRIVVFGDSRAETDVDAGQLQALLGAHPLTYNLSWHSQSLAYSFLLYQEVPRSVDTIIQFVSLDDLMNPSTGDPRVFEALCAYGYVPAPATVQAVSSAFGAERSAMFRLTSLQATLRSRWGIRQSADQILRTVVRHDLLLERERSDLLHPNAYTERIDERSFRRLMSSLGVPAYAPPITEEKLRLLEAMGGFAQARGIHVIVVLPPEYSGGVLRDHDRRAVELRKAAERIGMRVLDLSRALPDGQFVDPLHASEAGAERTTAILAKELRGSY